jgi:flavin reductase (DIM6/NTAB) family NADH-FMN oxidoreductase RutF
VARLDGPMFILTVGRPGRSGCLIGFATQCSIKPPRFLACISKKNHTFEAIHAAETVAVHFLSRENLPLAELFGGETGDEVDKFELCDWREGPDGVPVLDGPVGWFAGRVLERLDLGDHVGLWLDPFEAEDRGGDPDLGFQAAKHIHPGHEP